MSIVQITKFSLYVVWPWLSPPLMTNALHYILPVLRMTSCFCVMGPVELNERQHYVWSSLPDGSTSRRLLSTRRGKVCYHWLSCYIL